MDFESSDSGNITNLIQHNIHNLENFKYLLEASNLLSSSLNYEETLIKVAKLAVPRFADWCTVHTKIPEQNVQQIVVAHIDPKKVKLVMDYQKKYPPNNHLDYGVAHVINTGKAEYFDRIPAQYLKADTANKEQQKMLALLNLKSYICVPLSTPKRVLGAITFVIAESDRVYTENDFLVAKELGKIAGIAIDNAVLFAQAQEEINKRQEAEKKIILINKNLEKKVADRTQKLQMSNRELEDFAYVASHDLQEPLRKIQAFGNLLKEEYGSKLGGGNDYIDRMLNASSRMRGLINDLLTFSRVSTKTHPFEKVDLTKIANEVVSDLESSISDEGGKVDIQKLPSIEADALQMRQLFQNLLSNSIKFHKKNEPPIIQIYARQTDGKARVCVSDNGIGFDEKYLDKIFTLFERLHTRNEYKGTGIGLAVCRKIVERHKGTITARSLPDKGTTFELILPVKQG